MTSTVGNARLVITDGTVANTESLLVSLSGANLVDFLPKSPPAMNTIWASSPYLDGKHIVSKNFDNVIDTFVVDIHTPTQDNTIDKMNRFLQLLEQGVKYWTDEYSAHKFWLEIRAKCETEIRYAYVVDYSLPETNNPFDAPFEQETGGSTLEELQLSIEHTIWTDSLTIGANCVATTDGNNGPLPAWANTKDVPTQSTDDAYISGGAAISTVSAVEYIGADATPNPYGSGIRFRSVNISPTATIKAAYLMLVSTNNDAGATCKVRIKGELVLAPAAFSTYANYIGRARTTAYTDWQVPSWLAGTQYSSPNIKTVIQEVISQVGWAANNDIVIFIDDNGSSASAYRRFSSWDGASDPVLIIEYEDTVLKPYEIGNNTESCERRTFIQNHWRSQNITHIFIDDGGVWGTNQAYGHAANWNLLPALPAVNDAIYFGIAGDAGVVDIYSSTFNTLVFDLVIAAFQLEIIIEYWNGAAWVTVGATQPKFDEVWVRQNKGPQQIIWQYPSDWAQTTIQDIWGWWVRVRVTNNPLGVTTPIQRAYTIPFTISWNFIKVSGTQLKGDINGILNFLLAGNYDNDMAETFIISTRKVSRDDKSQFISIFPMSEFMDWPAGVTNQMGTAVSGAPVTATVGSESYYGTYALWTEAGASSFRNLGLLYLPAKTYAGRYRAFIRCRPDATTAVGEFSLRLYVASLRGSYATEYVFNKHSNEQEVIDLGLISFPSEIVNENPPDALSSDFIYVAINARCTGAIHVHLYDFILMPVDEMYLEVTNPNYLVTTPEDFRQSWKIVTSDEKIGPYGFRYKIDPLGLVMDDYYDIYWSAQFINAQLRVNCLGPFEIEPEEEYYIHFFLYTSSGLTTDKMFYALTAPSIDKNQRYMLMRGAS